MWPLNTPRPNLHLLLSWTMISRIDLDQSPNLFSLILNSILILIYNNLLVKNLQSLHKDLIISKRLKTMIRVLIFKVYNISKQVRFLQLEAYRVRSMNLIIIGIKIQKFKFPKHFLLEKLSSWMLDRQRISTIHLWNKK